jgi:serine/threonine-protein kinase
LEESQTTVSTIARRIALLLLLAVTFVASAMITIYALFQTGEVRVPNVVGMSQQDAERAVERAGLHFKLRRQHYDAEAPEGNVTEQDPAAGFPVKVGFDIKVDVSKGADPTGKTEEPPPPGPTNPVDGPVDNANANKKKRDSKNANTNSNTMTVSNANKNDSKAVNANKNTNKNTNKTDGKGVKSDEPGAVKPKDADQKKPEADIPPKPKPKPAPQVPPHD